MRFSMLLPAALLVAASALSFSPPAYANIVVAIDKSTQTMSVTVDGAQRYVWPVSTGRRGYDTPNGTFKVNRMDADHLSQEWDNAPMPHAMFFDMNGHAIHGFFDVKHLGQAVSHGCVRLSPDHAATLFDLVKQEGMNETTVIISGQTPASGGEYVARRAPTEQEAGQPMEIAPAYGPYGQQPYYRPAQQPYYGQQTYRGQQAPQPYYGQPQPYYGEQGPQPYYGQQPQPYPYDGRQSTYGYQQPAYGQPQYYLAQPYNQY